MAKFYPVRSLNFLATILIFFALIAGIATYLTFSYTDIWQNNLKNLVALLMVDSAILFVLIIVITIKIFKLWNRQRSDQAGAKLHRKFIVIFSLFTVTPAFFVAIFSGLVLNLTIQTWFNNRVKVALVESNKIAQAYLEEHKKVISANVVVMARELSQDFSTLLNNRDLFNQTLNTLTELRNLDEAIVFNQVPDVIARSRLSFLLEFETVSAQDLRKSQTIPVLFTSSKGNRVRALYKISNRNAYLLVGRIVDPAILKRIEEVKSTVSTYSLVEQYRQNVEHYCFYILIVITLLLLLCAIWIALVVAGRIAKPIGALVTAANKIGEGEFSVQVNHKITQDEIGQLISAFNRMSAHISDQRDNLMQVNQALDDRFQFIEDVFEGITAGIISIDQNYTIQLINSSALTLLGLDPVKKSTQLEKIFPEIAARLVEFDRKDDQMKINEIEKLETKIHDPEDYDKWKFDKRDNTLIEQIQIKIYRKGHVRTLLTRLVKEVYSNQKKGFIITFDDVSELVLAQKNAAWSDVARRIAHEIRNPLTPIQLSAERLRKKYGPQIVDEPEKYNSCVETIIRQVDHIGTMVKEFSNFARMPEPVLSENNIVQLIEQIIDQEKQSNPTIEFAFSSTHPTVDVLIDSAQLQQVITNIVQNAMDAITQHHQQQSSDLTHAAVATNYQGIIKIDLISDDNAYKVVCTDNGTGLPSGINRENLTEPYVTKKAKGTGLGLAIVKKIVEDHGGSLMLSDAPIQGAVITLTFPHKNKPIQK